MSDPTDYSSWFGQELKKLIDLLTARANQANPEEMNKQMMEIQRGVDYGTNNPYAIDKLLLKVGRNLIDSLEVYLRQMRPKSTAGIPPGGRATLLTGVEMDQSDSEDAMGQQFSVDELKGALATRKKEKVVKKMKGSLDLLKEYDES